MSLLSRKHAGLGRAFPPPAPRYWKGFDQEKDRQLAEELYTSQLEPNSKRERSARHALARLLTYYVKDENALEITVPLCMALLERGDLRLIFKRRKGKPKSNSWFEIAFFVGVRRNTGLKNEAAVAEAMAKFRVSRATVFKALKRKSHPLASDK
jgi:hypothetical protein